MKIPYFSSIIAAAFLAAGISGMQAQTTTAPATSNKKPATGQNQSTTGQNQSTTNQNQNTTNPNSARDLAPGRSTNPPPGQGGVIPGQAKKDDTTQPTTNTQSTTGTQRTTNPNATSTRDLNN